MAKYLTKQFWKSNDKKLSNDECIDERVVDTKLESSNKSLKWWKFWSKTKKSDIDSNEVRNRETIFVKTSSQNKESKGFLSSMNPMKNSKSSKESKGFLSSMNPKKNSKSSKESKGFLSSMNPKKNSKSSKESKGFWSSMNPKKNSKSSKESKGFWSSLSLKNCRKGSETEDSDDEPINETILNNEESKDQTITKPKASDSIEFDIKSLNAEMSVRQIRDLIESIHRLPKLEVNKPVITDPKRAVDMPVFKEQVLEIPEKSGPKIGRLLPKQVSEPEIHKRIRLEKVIFIQRKIRANNEMKIERKNFCLMREKVIFVQKRFRANNEIKIQRLYYQSIREKIIFIQRKFRKNKEIKNRRDIRDLVRELVILVESHVSQEPVVDLQVISGPKRAVDVIVLKEQVLEIPEKSETFFSKQVSEQKIHKLVHILSETDIKLLQICNQKDLIEQKLVFSDENCELLGKGSFGSVYSKTENVNNKDIKVVVKKCQMSICSNYGKTEYLREYKYSFSDIFIGLRLSDLKAFPKDCYYCENFSNILSNHFVYENQDSSEEEKQFRHFITNMSFAGKPIYLLNPISPKRGMSLARQLIASLAVAESVLEFEHRDLHKNNVLILQTKQKRVKFKINGKEWEIELHGFKLTLIDTTYSRIKFENQIYFNDLTNALARVAKLDSPQLTYHKWIYKKQCELTQNDWSRFCPKSNIYWCHSLLIHIYEIINKSAVDQSKDSKKDFRLLEKWKNTITQYNSVLEFFDSQTNVSQITI